LSSKAALQIGAPCPFNKPEQPVYALSLLGHPAQANHQLGAATADILRHCTQLETIPDYHHLDDRIITHSTAQPLTLKRNSKHMYAGPVQSPSLLLLLLALMVPSTTFHLELALQALKQHTCALLQHLAVKECMLQLRNLLQGCLLSHSLCQLLALKVLLPLEPDQ
jgi:hypothetical protein